MTQTTDLTAIRLTRQARTELLDSLTGAYDEATFRTAVLAVANAWTERVIALGGTEAAARYACAFVIRTAVEMVALGRELLRTQGDS